MPLYLIVLALAPVFFLLFYIWLRDRYEREPLSLVLWTFGAGVLSALLALVIGILLVPESTGVWREYLDPFLKVATVEEACKLLAVWLVVYRNPNFNEPMDGIVYAGAAALGFAAFENVLYVWKFGFATAVLRAVLAVPAHFLFGVTMGYYLSRFRFGGSRRRWVHLALALLAPVAMHGVFDVVAGNMGEGNSTRDLFFGALMYGLMAVLWVRGNSQVEEAAARSPFRWRARWRPRHYQTQPHMLQVVGHCPVCTAGVPAEASYCYRCGKPDPLGVRADAGPDSENDSD